MASNLHLVFILIGLVTFASCSEQKDEKHLFILSGQSNMVRMNHLESFNPRVEQAFGKDSVIVVKYARGTQPIRHWYKEWKSPTGEAPKVRGDSYDTLMLQIADHIQNYEFKTVTFVWMQGERDAKMQWGAMYEQSLLGLYQQLSRDLDRNDINFIIGRLNDFDMQNEKAPHWTLIREAQVKVGESNPRFTWIDTDDLNDGLNAKGVEMNNNLHLSVKGYEELGKRFAEKAIEMIRSSD